MPTTDDRDRPPRRPLGGGPGARPAPVTASEPPAADPAPAGGAALRAPERTGTRVEDQDPYESPRSGEPAPEPEAEPEPEPDPGTEPGGDAAPAARRTEPAAAAATGIATHAGTDAEASTATDAEAGTGADAGTSAETSAGASGPAESAAPRAAAVHRRSGPGREPPDPDSRFTVRLSNFEGPFDLLLQLISKHKLDVTEVALSKVTDEFMVHIRAMGPDWDLDQTTEFLVVAATLLDLKAARLLPAAEIEDEADLALLEARDLLFARLLQYRAYKRIATIFSDRLTAEARRHPRTVGLEPHHADLLPDVVISIGAEGFAKLAVKAMQPKAKPQVYVDHIHAPLVSVREQAAIVIARLRGSGEATFQELTADAPDTLTVVARFLALLELYRERAVVLEQPEALGSLVVRWTGGQDGAQPVVTDEFDQEPGERARAAEEEQT